MAISASCTIHCDGCGTDAGASQPTERDAIDYAQRGGWTVNEIAGFLGRPHGYALCEDCQEGRCRIVMQRDGANAFACMGESGHERDHGPWKLITSPPITGLAIDAEGGGDA